MEEFHVQQHFFNYLKSNLPKHLSLVDSMVELLGLSHDSVYRRIRGEKPITLPELITICEHFQISLDQVLQIKNKNIVFFAPEIDRDEYDFLAYLEGMVQQLKYFNSFSRKELIYMAKDIPVFHFFQFRDLAAFKMFFWIKSIINNPEYQDQSFSLTKLDFDKYIHVGQQIVKGYNEIPSVEIWNFESVNSMISQIEYYRDSGIFDDGADVIRVLESLEQLLLHIELQAKEGHKFSHGTGESGQRAPFRFYYNELIMGNNSGLVELDGKLSCFVNHGVIHYLMTSDERFNKRAFRDYQTLVKRSTIISQTGEKERTRFFKCLRDRVRDCKERSALLVK